MSPIGQYVQFACGIKLHEYTIIYVYIWYENCKNICHLSMFRTTHIKVCGSQTNLSHVDFKEKVYQGQP